MIALAAWERARFEDELKYYASFYQRDGDQLPLEHDLLITRSGREIPLHFLLVASPHGLAYESLEKVIFLPEGQDLVVMEPSSAYPAQYWRVLI